MTPLCYANKNPNEMSPAVAVLSVRRGGNDCIVPTYQTDHTPPHSSQLNIMIAFYSIFDILDLSWMENKKPNQPEMLE